MPDCVSTPSKTPRGSKEPPSKARQKTGQTKLNSKEKLKTTTTTKTMTTVTENTSAETFESPSECLKTAGTPLTKTPPSGKEERSIDKKRKGKSLNEVCSMELAKYRQRKQKLGDETGETIPDTVSLTASVKALKRKKERKKSKSEEQSKYREDKSIFKENGDPVWMYVERNEEVETADGVRTKFPELLEALAEDNLEPEDIRQWSTRVRNSENLFMIDLSQKEIPELDPLAPLEVLEERTDLYYDYRHVEAATLYNLLQMSPATIEKYCEERERPMAVQMLEEKRNREALERREQEESTCIDSVIEFDLENQQCVIYDRRRPIKSIRKLLKKMQKLSGEKGSKEKSKGSLETWRGSSES